MWTRSAFLAVVSAHNLRRRLRSLHIPLKRMVAVVHHLLRDNTSKWEGQSTLPALMIFESGVNWEKQFIVRSEQETVPEQNYTGIYLRKNTSEVTPETKALIYVCVIQFKHSWKRQWWEVELLEVMSTRIDHQSYAARMLDRLSQLQRINCFRNHVYQGIQFLLKHLNQINI